MKGSLHSHEHNYTRLPCLVWPKLMTPRLCDAVPDHVINCPKSDKKVKLLRRLVCGAKRCNEFGEPGLPSHINHLHGHTEHLPCCDIHGKCHILDISKHLGYTGVYAAWIMSWRVFEGLNASLFLEEIQTRTLHSDSNSPLQSCKKCFCFQTALPLDV